MDLRCTHCQYAKLYTSPTPCYFGVVTCPYRKGKNLFERYAPADAFSELAEICDKFELDSFFTEKE